MSGENFFAFSRDVFQKKIAIGSESAGGVFSNCQHFATIAERLVVNHPERNSLAIARRRCKCAERE